MTKLRWDQVGERLYEAGVDRGVLYLADNSGVVWNGLTSVEEDMSDDSSEPVYFDGVKVNDNPSTGDFSATLSAITYPDEFEKYEGVEEISDGVFVDGQSAKLFGLSFRTLVGNDIDGLDHGYKVHLVYNLTAVPGNKTRSTFSDITSPAEFTWQLSGVPMSASGYRPTAHIMLDSRFLPADVIEAIEALLYGTDGSDTTTLIFDGGTPTASGPDILDGGTPSSVNEEIPEEGLVVSAEPRLPSINELMSMVTFWDPKDIIPHTDTGLAELVDTDIGDLTPIKVAGIFTTLPTSRLVETNVDGVFELSI